jgi:hypothetical protein
LERFEVRLEYHQDEHGNCDEMISLCGSTSYFVDALLAFNPLDVNHVKRCNQAEAEFWRKNEGYQTKPSDQLLQFDCGGQVRYSKKFTTFGS